MKTSIKGLNLIKYFEGLRLHAYQCQAKVWTIGYGHTRNVSINDFITEDKASLLLHQDVSECEKTITKHIHVSLTQNQFDALVSFVFNLGADSFKTSTLLKKINACDYDGAAQEFGRWVYSGDKINSGLERRREAEKSLFLR